MNGTLLTTYAYDSYGNLLSSTGSVTNPWRFAGGYFDSSTGLYKYGTRYYNPGFGRWSQQDPVRGHLDDPTSLNQYVYAGDDPVNFTDPSGRDCWLTFLGAIVLAIALLRAFWWVLMLIEGLTDTNPILGVALLYLYITYAGTALVVTFIDLINSVTDACGLPRLFTPG